MTSEIINTTLKYTVSYYDVDIQVGEDTLTVKVEASSEGGINFIAATESIDLWNSLDLKTKGQIADEIEYYFQNENKMTEEEIKQKLEDIKLKMFWMINPNGENIFHLTEIELNLIQQQSFNLGVTLSAENAEYTVNDDADLYNVNIDIDKDSILKLLIK